MALEVGGLFVAQDLPNYLYSQVKAVVDKFAPSEPSALPSTMRSFCMTRADFMKEVRTRIDSLFSVWYVENNKLGYAPYLLKLLANVWTIVSRCRYCVYTSTHGTWSNGGSVPVVQDEYGVYRVIFKVGQGTVAARKTNNPEPPKTPMANRGARMPTMSVSVKPGPSVNQLNPTPTQSASTKATAKEGFTPANIGNMPENYYLYEYIDKINNAALARGELITVAASLKRLISVLADGAYSLSNSKLMPDAVTFSSECNIEGLGVPTSTSLWASYLVPGFISANNEAAFGVYNCHSNCHSNCHGNRSRR